LIREIITLTKPRISLLSVATAAVGLSLAPGEPSAALTIVTLIGTLLLVGSANTLNMYLERDVDGRMARTKNRPLPAGRLAPPIALWFGVAQALVAIPLLTFGANALSGLLGAVALVIYVLVYTPMKQLSTASLLVGAIPGAMPPLLGWTAASGEITVAAIALFGVIFLWQVPHFIAIAMFRKRDYVNAGMKVLPAVRGDDVARRTIVGYLVAQVAVTIVLVPLGLGGTPYLVGAVVLGGLMLALGVAGLGQGRGGDLWAKRVFLASIAYLPLLFGLLVAF
jgi:protoheme IX farnesyltransferase